MRMCGLGRRGARLLSTGACGCRRGGRLFGRGGWWSRSGRAGSTRSPPGSPTARCGTGPQRSLDRPRGTLRRSRIRRRCVSLHGDPHRQLRWSQPTTQAAVGTIAAEKAAPLPSNMSITWPVEASTAATGGRGHDRIVELDPSGQTHASGIAGPPTSHRLDRGPHRAPPHAEPAGQRPNRLPTPASLSVAHLRSPPPLFWKHALYG